jgi:UDP-glucose 4-epimerase
MFSTREDFFYRNEGCFMRKVLVTGGAGFIGSHLVDALMSGKANVHVFDNLSSGSIENIKQWLKSPNFTLIKGDLLNPSDMEKLRLNCYDFIFHLAANPEVRVSSINPEVHFQQNVVATYNLLECMRKCDSASTIAFTSTSTVYGESHKNSNAGGLGAA